MGNGCSDPYHEGTHPPYITLDGSHTDLQVESNSKKTVILRVRKEDQEKLRLTAERGGPVPIIQIVIAIQRGVLARVFVGVKGRVLQHGRYIGIQESGEDKSILKLSLFASHTENFKPNDYLVTVVGGPTLPSLVHISARATTSTGDPNDPHWLRDMLNRVEHENDELRRRMHAQSQVIIRLKNRLIEYGDQLIEKDNDINEHKQRTLNEKQKRARAVIQGWRMRTLVPFFIEWRKTAHIQKQRKTELLTKVVNRLSNSHIWRAFRQWKQYMDECKITDIKKQLEDGKNALHQQLLDHKKKRAQALIHSWRQKSLISVFMEWKKQAQRRKELLGKVVVRMQNSLTWRAFRTWRTYIEHDRVEDIKRKMQAGLNAEKKKRALTLINTWRQKSMISVFQEWRAVARSASKRKHELMAKVVRRLAQSGLWRGFRIWRSYIENERLSEVRRKLGDVNNMDMNSLQAQLIAERRKRVEVLIKTWRMRSVAPVFLEWRKQVSEGKTYKKQMLGKIVLRLQKAPLWRAFRQWKNNIDYQVRHSYKKELEDGLAGARGIQDKYQKTEAELNALRSRYDEIKSKFVVAKARKKRYQICYDKLLAFFRTFRIEVASRLERDMRPFCSRKCRCDVCTMKARSTVELVMDMLMKFDKDFELKSLLKDMGANNYMNASMSSTGMITASSSLTSPLRALKRSNSMTMHSTLR